MNPITKKVDEKNTQKVQNERKRLSEFIETLDFNKQFGDRFLVMIAGDMHMLAYDQGMPDTNQWGSFPIFQCAPLDKKSSCKSGLQWSIPPSFHNSQYCVFEFRQEQS